MGDGWLRAALALSSAGSLLLPLFALLLRLQPRFVRGLRVDAARAEVNCLLSGACYGGVWLAALLALCVRARRRRALKRGDVKEGDARTAFDERFNLAHPEHASEAFALAMRALDARPRPAIEVRTERRLAPPSGEKDRAAGGPKAT